ncbi:hypothetical protein Fmac_021103 [Flemingia macrophylla]|uniref:Uncharacterized protein n=1 Tax=Flemingia macrophylla TaxID=520843 RepID=A0ABD1LW08_9FABA
MDRARKACSISKLKLMVDQFAELGVQNKKLTQFIARSPQLLLREPKNLLLSRRCSKLSQRGYTNLGTLFKRTFKTDFENRFKSHQFSKSRLLKPVGNRS